LYLETADYIININDESPNDIAKKIAGYIKWAKLLLILA
jgi:hypothetical protein